MRKLGETLFMILFLGFITGIIPFALIILFDSHPVITTAIISPVLFQFGKEVIGDVLENYYN